MYQGCPCQGEWRGTGGDWQIIVMLKIKGVRLFRKGVNLAGLSQVQPLKFVMLFLALFIYL
jgi:hypothetical protein